MLPWIWWFLVNILAYIILMIKHDLKFQCDIFVFVWIIFIILSWILCCLRTSNYLTLGYFDNCFSHVVYMSNYPSFCFGLVLIIVVFPNKLYKIISQTKNVVFNVFVINLDVIRAYFVLQGMKRYAYDLATTKDDHWSCGDGEDSLQLSYTSLQQIWKLKTLSLT